MNDFYDGLLTQPANVGTQGKPDERGTNFLLAMVRGIGPKDEIEAMMAAQMAAVHMTTMTFARPSPMWITSSSRIVRNGHSQAGADVCGAGGSAQAISDRGASKRSRCSTLRSMRADRRSSDRFSPRAGGVGHAGKRCVPANHTPGIFEPIRPDRHVICPQQSQKISFVI